MAYPDYNSREEVAGWAVDYIAAHTKPDFFIGPNNDHQLDRWWIVPRNKFQNVYLHKFLRSDDDRALHDHPFDNTSWILSGQYLEHTKTVITHRQEGSIINRKAYEAHRIELMSGPVITLFFTGPTIREWGFHCPNGWRHWKEFVNIVEGGNSIGRGCE